jgi:hypothetical protein
MGPLLLLLALLAGGTAWYEFNWQEQSSAGFQAQIEEWQSQLAKLKSENKQLGETKANLAQQAQMARSMPTPALLAPSMTGQPPAPPSLPPPSGAAPIEDLGTFTTINGTTYQQARLLKIEATDIIISSTDGITQVQYAIMPPDLQKKFGWDPQKSAEVNAAALRYQEQLEAARESAAANGAPPAPTTPDASTPDAVPAPAMGTTPAAP